MKSTDIIKSYIVENNIEQTFIAEKAGIPEELLRRSLEGKRSLKADEFISICEVLSLDLPYFRSKKPNASEQRGRG